MNDIQLSKNFKLSEFTASETARRRKINNDQLILETANHLDFWIHVSCRRDPKLNRHHVVYYMKKTWSDSKKRVDRLSSLSTCIAFRLGAFIGRWWLITDIYQDK